MPIRLSTWWITCILSSPFLTGPPTDAPGTLLAVDLAATQRAGAGVSPAIAKAAERWPKVQIIDPVTRDAARRALDDAARWLSGPQCARLFSEFQDANGQSLDTRLHQLESTPADYLHLIYFLDGERHPTCQRHGILAFTEVGSRVVYVCGRDFARGWNKQPREVVATLIHEMLHSLGLGENPPTPREISDRVQRLCWQ